MGVRNSDHVPRVNGLCMLAGLQGRVAFPVRTSVFPCTKWGYHYLFIGFLRRLHMRERLKTGVMMALTTPYLGHVPCGYLQPSPSSVSGYGSFHKD